MLPKGYEELKTRNRYIKISELPEGEYKFRVVQQPVCGYVEWCNNVPYRYKVENKPSTSLDPEKPLARFWSMYVWDYQQKGLYVMEVKQAGILDGLISYGENPDWGSFLDYDIKIIKKGSGKSTKYSVQALPHKAFSKEIIDSLKKDPCNLEYMFEGKDPWTGNITSKTAQAYSSSKATAATATFEEVESSDDKSFISTLSEKLEVQGINTSSLETYLTHLGNTSKKPRSSEDVAKMALVPELFNNFKDKYLQAYPEAAIPF